mgnify:FL=1
MLKAPKFWFSEKNLAVFFAKVLFPLSVIWEFFSKRRILNGKYEEFTIPIICVGNINIGGSGKTPATIALAKIFLKNKTKVHIISKGYKGKITGPKKVNETDDAYGVGDEPILMSKVAPVWVAKQRRNAIIAAIEDGAELLILDDGFQDTSIKKTLSIVTVDAEIGFGNRKILPSGPLREPIPNALSRSDVLLVIGRKHHREKFIKSIDLPNELNVFGAEMEVVKSDIHLDKAKFVAVAGIGHPEKFFNSIEKFGGEIRKKFSLPDHENYTPHLLCKLKKASLDNNAQLITTEKDFVRIPKNERHNFIFLPIKLKFSEELELINSIKSVINQSFK